MNMTTNKPTPSDKFLDVLTDEIIAMPDEQVLEGVDAKAVQAFGLALLNSAKSEAGRRRLTAAKARAAGARTQRPISPVTDISVAEARRYLAGASNDARYTLAARNLNDMSDEDIFRLYAQMKSLEAQADGQKGPAT